MARARSWWRFSYRKEELLKNSTRIRTQILLKETGDYLFSVSGWLMQSLEPHIAKGQHRVGVTLCGWLFQYPLKFLLTWAPFLFCQMEVTNQRPGIRMILCVYEEVNFAVWDLRKSVIFPKIANSWRGSQLQHYGGFQIESWDQLVSCKINAVSVSAHTVQKNGMN